jgi:glycosyltransferase involved in cell wall biosynthesis
MSTSPSLHACTVATRAQLPSVRVLCDSLRAHHPDAEITVLVLDGPADLDAAGARSASPRDVGLAPGLLARLAIACTAAELADVVTPRLVRMLVQEGAPAVVAFSPETEVFAPLTDVVELAREHGIVLVPRLDAVLPDDDLEPTPAQLAAAGPFAAEFVAVGESAVPFLDRWCEREDHAALTPRDDPPGPWAEFVSALFSFHVLRDPGCGVSIWNAHERDLRAAARDSYEVAGSPLRWAHFDGFSPDAPYLLSAALQRPRVLLSEHPVLAGLCSDHGARLRAAGYHGAARAYAYDALPDGKEIDARMRAMYIDGLRGAKESGEPEPPSPFGPDGEAAFVAWIKEPVAPPADPRVSRYLARVRDEHATIRQRFPSIAGEGAEDYIASFRTGDAAVAVPDWVLPTDEDVLALIKERWRARPAGPRPRGVNVVGYVTAVLGVGHVARVLTSTLDDAGVPKAVVANRQTVSEQSLPFEACFASQTPYDVSLLCVNADHTKLLAQEVGPEFFAERRTIGVWFWEVEDFPASMIEAFDFVDEVWVASDFVLEAIASVSPKPVRKFPLPVVVPSVPDGVPRTALGLPENRFLFLFVYDFLSTVERKNPLGLIDAYTRAFGPDDGAALVLKSINGEKRLEQLEQVRAATAERPDVLVLDEYLTPTHHSALLGHCDAYVSLHRSEGFGLDMAAAMGLGKPVIATGYSGNLEFMDDSTSYLVDYELEPIGPGCEPYPAHSRWAGPRLDHAAELMRRVVERPDEARDRGRRACASITTEFSPRARSAALAEMVEDARSRHAGRGAWRKFFTEDWRIHRHGVEAGVSAALWLPDGTSVDPTMRRLMARNDRGAPDPELDLGSFYAWLNERVYPPTAPVVSRYLYELWRTRPDLQSHFPDVPSDPRTYLAFLVDRGHDDTEIPHQLLPTDDDVRRATRSQVWRKRREKLGRAVRSARQRAAGLVNRR